MKVKEIAIQLCYNAILIERKVIMMDFESKIRIENERRS